MQLPRSLVLLILAGCTQRAAAPPLLHNRTAEVGPVPCLPERIAGKVIDLDARKRPIGGATILVMGEETVTAMAMTGADGTFVVDIEPEHTEVAVFYGSITDKQPLEQLCRGDAIIAIHTRTPQLPDDIPIP